MEAAHLAWAPLGWTTAWVSELDPSACALLAHHLPDVPNLGDMTTIPARVRAGEVEATEVFIAGTPCQSFSVAGARRSLDDARGNLALTYCEILNAIDDVRRDRGEPECIAVWENVPGVLSTRDNAFGCFLGELAGEDCALLPPRDRWPDAGVVVGPRRTLAWRVLDAQYFGLAQRRRRVFVVGSARYGFDPFSVLFEREGVQRDSPPRREAQEGIAGTIRASAAQRGGIQEQDGSSGLIPEIARCVTTGEAKRQDYETCTIIPATAHTLRADGFDASEDGTGRGTPIIPIAFDTTQITCPNNHSNPKVGDPCHTLSSSANPPAIAFDSRQDCVSSDVVFGALGSSHPQAQAVAVSLRGRAGGGTAELGDEVGNCLRASQGGGDKPHVLAGMAVRRLTPRECERLQGAPDDWTLVPNAKGQPMADGPRYKMLGNSFAVPVIRWIGRQIERASSINTISEAA